MPQFYLKTFGCQMNEHDSQKMEALLQGDGFLRTEKVEEADVVVVNTCSIREKSYQKALSTIGQIGKGETVVAVTGCVASHDGKAVLRKFPHVDILLGPDHITSLPRLIRQVKEKHQRYAETDFEDISDYEFPSPILLNVEQSVANRGGSPSGVSGRVKAYVTIMKGCDNRCSFCIVPFTRGPEVSRPSGEIIEEIRRLEEAGVREVMLLGQIVNSYGRKSLERLNFARLLRLIDEKTSLPRLRYTSPHPKDLSRELIEEYGRNEKLCPHIHLPVQSGSNRILKRMRRSYTREVYLRKVERIRKIVPEIAITSDFIVGFPGESDDDFEQTLSLVREVAYDASYSFVFSPRPDTEAAAFQDDVPLPVKRERLGRLQELQESLSRERNAARVGRVEQVLVEGPSREGGGQLTGRTPHGRIVNFVGDENLTGAILMVRVIEASPYSLKGVLC